MYRQRFEARSASNRLLLNRGRKQTLDHIKKLQRAKHHGRELDRACYFYRKVKPARDKRSETSVGAVQRNSHVCKRLDILLIFLLSPNRSAEFPLAVSQESKLLSVHL